MRLKKNVPRQTSLAQQRASNIASNIAHRLLHVCPCLIGAAGCVLCVIGGALFVTTNKLSVADLSRNEEGVVKNNFCTRKQLEITISFVSLFGGHIVLFPLLSTVPRRRHLPHPCVLHGHGPRPRAQRHTATRVVSRVTCPAVATILADTDPEAWPADSPLDLVPPPLCLPFPFFRHVSGV